MSNIAMCANKNCPLKNKCYRYRAKPSEMQSYGMFRYNDGCEYFIKFENGRVSHWGDK